MAFTRITVKIEVDMNTLYKPNGKEVTVNDNSLEYALSIGWNDKKPVKKAEPKKPTKKAE